MKRYDHSWWIKYVDQQAGKSEYKQTCKHKNFSLLDFCVMINDIAEKLGPGENLLDIGAGNGLNDIALSHLYRNIVAVEPAPNLFQILKTNISDITHIKAINDLAENLNLGQAKFDRVLLAGVAPQLDREDDLFNILNQVKANFAPQCRILLARVSDASCKTSYLSALPDILSRKGYSQLEIEEIVARNQRSAWHDYDIIASYFVQLGFSVRRLPTDRRQLLYEQKYDVVAERGIAI